MRRPANARHFTAAALTNKFMQFLPGVLTCKSTTIIISRWAHATSSRNFVFLLLCIFWKVENLCGGVHIVYAGLILCVKKMCLESFDVSTQMCSQKVSLKKCKSPFYL